MSRWTVQLASRMYLRGMMRDDALVDMCEGETQPDRWGVLLGSGCGLMMAVLDHVPFRYCLDIDELKLGRDARRIERFSSFVQMANVAPDGGIALAGWFSITPIDAVQDAFSFVPGEQPVVYARGRQIIVPGFVDTLEEFITRTRARFDPFTKETV